MASGERPVAHGTPWLLAALVCLAAGVVPGWVDLVPDAAAPWAFIFVAAIAVGALAMALRGNGPTWMKVATSIAALLALMLASIFAGLSLQM